MKDHVFAIDTDRVCGPFDPVQSLLRSRLADMPDEELAELEADIGAIALGAGLSASINNLLFPLTDMREAA